jgi:hypothetical protein
VKIRPAGVAMTALVDSRALATSPFSSGGQMRPDSCRISVVTLRKFQARSQMMLTVTIEKMING